MTRAVVAGLAPRARARASSRCEISASRSSRAWLSSSCTMSFTCYLEKVWLPVDNPSEEGVAAVKTVAGMR